MLVISEVSILVFYLGKFEINEWNYYSVKPFWAQNYFKYKYLNNCINSMCNLYILPNYNV